MTETIGIPITARAEDEIAATRGARPTAAS